MLGFLGFRLRMLLELAGTGLFVYGFFTHHRFLADVGGGIVAGWYLISLWSGALHPLVPLLAVGIASQFFTPWRDGAFWVAAVATFINVPFYIVWLFRPPMQDTSVPGPAASGAAERAHQPSLPSSIAHFSLVEPPKRRRSPVLPIILGIVMVVGSAIAWTMRSNGAGNLLSITANISQAIVEPTVVPLSSSPSSTSVDTPQKEIGSAWAQRTFADTVTLEYPEAWAVDRNGQGLIKINGVL